MKVYIHVCREPYSGSITRLAIYDNLAEARKRAYAYHQKNTFHLETGSIVAYEIGQGSVVFDHPIISFDYDIKVIEKESGEENGWS